VRATESEQVRNPANEAVVIEAVHLQAHLQKIIHGLSQGGSNDKSKGGQNLFFMFNSVVFQNPGGSAYPPGLL
jgi:hypothetical protein